MASENLAAVMVQLSALYFGVCRFSCSDGSTRGCTGETRGEPASRYESLKSPKRERHTETLVYQRGRRNSKTVHSDAGSFLTYLLLSRISQSTGVYFKLRKRMNAFSTPTSCKAYLERQ